jgi:hypothetical protein
MNYSYQNYIKNILEKHKNDSILSDGVLITFLSLQDISILKKLQCRYYKDAVKGNTFIQEVVFNEDIYFVATKPLTYKISLEEFCKLCRGFEDYELFGINRNALIQKFEYFRNEVEEQLILENQADQVRKKLCTYLNSLEDWLNPNKKSSSIIVIPSSLEEKDYSLINIWNDNPHLRQENFTHIVQHVKENPNNFDLGRLMSARLAEKAVIEFYRSNKYKVTDISILQISDEGNTEWKDYDLLIDGKIPIDVKNSRASRKNNRNYTEHCVPRFKNKRNGQNIQIAGVFSQYLRPSEITNNQNEILTPINQDKRNNIQDQFAVTFLGITHKKILEDIKGWFEIPNVFEIEFRSRSDNSYFLPPWMFDLPEFIYVGSRQRFVETINKSLKKGLDALLKLQKDSIPFLLILGQDVLTTQTILNSLSPQEMDFIRLVQKWRKEIGLSLPFIYLSVLAHFVKSLADNKEEYFCPINYQQLVFPLGNKRLPLFTIDPLGCLSSLIEALTILLTVHQDIIKQYKIFKLVNANILLGKKSKSEHNWQTLIAYCGGWKKDKTPCGRNPLILGQEDLCPECGKLICPDCGLCLRSCPQYSKRILQNNTIQSI